MIARGATVHDDDLELPVSHPDDIDMAAPATQHRTMSTIVHAAHWRDLGSFNAALGAFPAVDV